MEIVRQAGSSADGRIQILANYLRDIMREIALEDWVERQGGLVSCLLSVNLSSHV